VKISHRGLESRSDLFFFISISNLFQYNDLTVYEQVQFLNIILRIDMNKYELVNKMALYSDLTQTDCKKALEAFMKIVIENLKNHEQVALTNFGTFLALKRKRRIGVNPATGKKMTIPEVYVTKFRASKTLKKLPK
jgi:nucleoid DNA-binding protein